MNQTRRLAAVLVADVVGYSRLMGSDEEGTLERFKALRRELLNPQVAEHHGRIVKNNGEGLRKAGMPEERSSEPAGGPVGRAPLGSSSSSTRVESISSRIFRRRNRVISAN
jgi:class 3 adenylate cyclase